MPERDCSTCVGTNLQVERGCEKDSILPINVLGEETRRCPRRPVFESPEVFGYYLSVHKDYEKGILPEPGSRAEQCAYVLDVMAELDSVFALIKDHKRKEAESKGESGGKRSRISSRG